jgi:hypothetical protein
MGAQLAGTVYVKDPDTHQTVQLAPGTCPEPRLAALVTNPAAWVGDASGDTSPADTQSDEPTPTEGDGSDDTKPAAKRAARKPARGRTAAAEGTGGQ